MILDGARYRVYIQGDLDASRHPSPAWFTPLGVPGSVRMIEATAVECANDQGGLWINDTLYPWWRVVQIEREWDVEQQAGNRCTSTEPGFPSTRCQRDVGHAGKHIYTSGADGRSVTWE